MVQKIMGVKKKNAPNPTNWLFEGTAAYAKYSNGIVANSCSLKDKFPPVYTQTYGNCTSNAVLACDAYYYHRGTKWVPSTVFTYYNQKKMSEDKPWKDDGTSIEVALDAVRKYGACNVKIWPNTEPFDKKPSKEAYADGLKGHELTKYYRVKSLSQIKKALNSGYPVPACIAWAFKEFDNSYIMNTPTPEDIENANWHAVVIVGYDDNTKLFEIRNSWSAEWANNGYAYITYDVMKKIIDFWDSYAVVK